MTELGGQFLLYEYANVPCCFWNDCEDGDSMSSSLMPQIESKQQPSNLRQRPLLEDQVESVSNFTLSVVQLTLIERNLESATLPHMER